MTCLSCTVSVKEKLIGSSLLRKVELKVCGIWMVSECAPTRLQLRDSDMAEISRKEQSPAHQAASFIIPEARPALLVSWSAFPRCPAVAEEKPCSIHRELE